MPSPRPLQLRDPAALKALAHPARQELIRMLDHGRALTATHASEHLGISPSAVSHHLRLLQKYGVVERVTMTGSDGRERPWRMRVAGLNLQPHQGDYAGQTALLVWMRRELDRLLHRMERLMPYLPDRSPGRRRDSPVTGLATSRAHLTADEAREVGAALDEVLARLRRHERRAPARGRDEYELVVSFTPADPDTWAERHHRRA